MKDAKSFVEFLGTPESDRYFGRTFVVKADVLATLLSGGKLCDVAAKHRLTKSALTRHAKRARAVFSIPG
ncbi:MAG: hypothetical protein QM813_10885 [Verrucomicrobiota bacterium]